jgi:capsular exopolysaccharide synthesis family protein
MHYVDRTVKTPDGLLKITCRPVLGVIPLLEEGTTPEEATADLRSPFSEAYRSVRTSLQFATANGIPRSLLITSAAATEGKTTSAIELARNISQLGLKVALVDADLRNPSVHKILGLPNDTGLSSFLSGAVAEQDTVQLLPGQTLSVVTSGPLPPSPPELLASDRLPALLASLRERFDVVVVDGPPVLGLADAPLLAHHVDGTVLVAAAEQTHSDALATALGRLHTAHAHVLGTLLTRFDMKRKGEGYGYTYYSYGGARP